MFRGANPITMDDKGRIAIPARYRDELLEDSNGQIVCTIDIYSPCLLLYPMAEWEQVEKRLRGLRDNNPSERRYKRLMLGNAVDNEIDKNGRFNISPNLRAHAGLTKQLMLVGQLNKFEIWDLAAWEARQAEDMAIIESGDFELTDNLQDFNL